MKGCEIMPPKKRTTPNVNIYDQLQEKNNLDAQNVEIVQNSLTSLSEQLSQRQQFFQDGFNAIADRLQEISRETTECKTQLKTLIGNGQPGRISLLENAVQELREYRTTIKGYLAGVCGVIVVLGSIAHYIIDVFVLKH